MTAKTFKWAACALSAFVLSSAAAAATTNLVKNGDFSASTPWNPNASFLPSTVDDWDARHFDSQQTAGGDWFQNTAIANASSAYGDFGRPSSAVLAMYNLGSASQLVTVGDAFTFRLDWEDAAPTTSAYNGGYMISGPTVKGLRYDVRVNNAVVGSFSTAIGTGFVNHSLDITLFAGRHLIEFVGLDLGETYRFGGSNQYAAQSVTHVALLDNVVLTAVPEPSTVLLLCTGAGVLAAWASRRSAAHR